MTLKLQIYGSSIRDVLRPSPNNNNIRRVVHESITQLIQFTLQDKKTLFKIHQINQWTKHRVNQFTVN